MEEETPKIEHEIRQQLDTSNHHSKQKKITK